MSRHLLLRSVRRSRPVRNMAAVCRGGKRVLGGALRRPLSQSQPQSQSQAQGGVSVAKLREQLAQLDEARKQLEADFAAARAKLDVALQPSASAAEGGATEASQGVPRGLRVGGPFARQENPAFLETRSAMFDQLLEKQQARRAGPSPAAGRAGQSPATADAPSVVVLRLPDGATATVPMPQQDISPLDLAEANGIGNIAKGKNGSVVARLSFSGSEAAAALQAGAGLAAALCGDDDDESVQAPASALTRSKGGRKAALQSVLWDLTNPVPFASALSSVDGLNSGVFEVEFLGHEDPDAQQVLRHSSAHILGACFENLFGAKLTVGPPTSDGFFYDAYLGDEALTPDDLSAITKFARKNFINRRLPFERISLSKEEALELFADNPFKIDILRSKVPDGSTTSAYRIGNMVDLCLGPHVPHAGHIGSFEAISVSRSYFKGDAENGDPLQRVYGVAFNDKKGVKDWKKWRDEAESRNHRKIGERQDLFFFSHYSPGSAFFTPHGAVVYQRLVDFVRRECRRDGIREVVTPNIFKLGLWETSGHAQHYLDDMFVFDTDDGDQFGLKPMNCPAHCVMYKHRTRSYRDLPIRYLDFGALHRNELSGALGGLTRVRRFQQDDVHIFCRRDQVKQEVRATLAFLERVYNDVLGMKFSACLSTRPAKAMGDIEAWNEAEAVMAESLDEFCGDEWELNPGDGAFYGPKIDVRVQDALGRFHQCATVQLDFQLPLRFDLSYRAAENTAAKADGLVHDADVDTHATMRTGEERPVIIHRAMLGSVERMMAVLSEHYNGHWPLWLSPRQVATIPVSPAFNEYADEVNSILEAAGLETSVDISSKTLGKKVREAQMLSFNYQFVVGAAEAEAREVSVRDRHGAQLGTMPLDEAVSLLKEQIANYK